MKCKHPVHNIKLSWRPRGWLTKLLVKLNLLDMEVRVDFTDGTFCVKESKGIPLKKGEVMDLTKKGYVTLGK